MRETSNILLDTYEANNKTSWLTTYNENLEKVDNFAGTANTRIQQNETNITTINNEIELIKTNIATLSEEGTNNSSSISQLQTSINDLNVNVEANTAKNNLQDQNISENLNKINDLQATTEGQYQTLLNQVSENVDSISTLQTKTNNISWNEAIFTPVSTNNIEITKVYFKKYDKIIELITQLKIKQYVGNVIKGNLAFSNLRTFNNFYSSSSYYSYYTTESDPKVIAITLNYRNSGTTNTLEYQIDSDTYSYSIGGGTGTLTFYNIITRLS